MVNVTNKMMDDAEAAYRRSTGSAPYRAGLRAALHAAVSTAEARDDLRKALALCNQHEVAALIESALEGL